MKEGKIVSISGPLVVAKGIDKTKMNNIILLGENEIFGEVIKIVNDKVYIQAYEDTNGLKVGDKAIDTEQPLSVELGPGLIGSIFDGIQRPLDKIYDKQGIFVKSGSKIKSLDRNKKWHFIPKVNKNDILNPGDIIGEVKESSLIIHKIMVPYNIRGKVKFIAKEDDYTIEDNIITIENNGKEYNLNMINKWPIRIPRPYKEKIDSNIPLITGQRVIDTFFPVTKGGTVAIPGPFGSGKTVTQHQLAKWSDADIVVYIGCGERGNEMTEILVSFPELKDPKSGKPLMDRTVLIANTSNMPIAAREASIYTGITIAEYYRDMGYDVAIMADSTSRWAEALREISSRLEEMPGEEGYPAYLGRRIGEFYERAGKVITLGNRTGSVTIIGAVSPPGGDFNEPVTQNTLRYVKVFWALDSSLANIRHFPAINWLNSYSLYKEKLDDWYRKNIAKDFPDIRDQAMDILEKENEINQIVQLVGYDSLSEKDKLILLIAKMIREDFLQQFAFDEVDTYSSLQKQYKILKLILEVYNKLYYNINNIKIDEIRNKDFVIEISKLKITKEDELDKKIEYIEGLLNKIINQNGN